MIKLCYVQGINEVDTPWFATKEAQSAFFEKSVKWKDEDSYYPPYFMNTIRLSADDVPFNDVSKKVNYCILEYEGKDYYYFIDSIDYVTDDLVEITIEMDTIQTYLFDMNVTNPIISRMPIKRWDDNATFINRNYIRENLSNGNMVQKSKEIFTEATDIGWLIVTASDGLPNISYVQPNSGDGLILTASHSGLVSYINPATGRKSSYRANGLVTYAIPYLKSYDNYAYAYMQCGQGVKVRLDMPQATLNALSTATNVLSIRYVPTRLFADISVQKSGSDLIIKARYNTYKLNLYEIDGTFVKSVTNDWCYFVPFGFNDDGTAPLGGYAGFVIDYPAIDTTVDQLAKFYNEPSLRLMGEAKSEDMSTFSGEAIEPNTKKGVAFSSRYVPAMIDESYMTVGIEMNGSVATPPLYYSRSVGVNYEIYSTIDGAVATTVSFDEDSIPELNRAIGDAHSIASLDDNYMEYNLLTDPWKNYQVEHKGSMITDWIALAGNSVATGAGVAGIAIASSRKGKAFSSNSGVPSSEGYNVSSLPSVSGYVTGFREYRKHVYAGNRVRDPKTGRFKRDDIFTYTGGL